MLTSDIHPPPIEMITVPAGEFIMGPSGSIVQGPNGQSVRVEDEQKVALTEYEIGRYPITNAQYLPFLQDTGHPPPRTWRNGYEASLSDHPVSGVAWADAWLYCAWLRQKTGLSYHLPTEAQWEKAATWNPTTKRKQLFPWGNTPDGTLCNVAHAPKEPMLYAVVVHGMQANFDPFKIGTTPVGTYSPRGDSPYGCADMIGNVDEWCNSALIPYPYDACDGREALRSGPYLGGERRGTRGGDWYSALLPASRRNAASDWWVTLWGFRVALSPALDEAHTVYETLVQQHIESVEAQLHNQISESPDSAKLWAFRGNWRLGLYSRFGIERYADVEHDLTRCIELADADSAQKQDVNVAWVYYNRALARDKQGKHQEAHHDICMAITLDPRDPDGYILRAKIACKIADWEQAQQDLAVAAELRAHPLLLAPVQAQLCAGQGKRGETLEFFTQAINAPLYNALDIPELHIWRGNLYEQAGRTREAMSDYCHYLLWSPDAPQAPSLSEKLERFRINRT